MALVIKQNTSDRTLPTQPTSYSITCLSRYGHLKRIQGIILIGHSASGKSTAARILGMNRARCDFDVYVLNEKNRPENLLPAFLTSSEPMLVIGNNKYVLSKLNDEKSTLVHDRIIVYLCRPKDLIKNTLTYVNEDNMKHPKINNFDKYYDYYHAIYASIADYTLNYTGQSTQDLACILSRIVKEATEHGHISLT